MNKNPAAEKKASWKQDVNDPELLFGVEDGDADSAATSGGWQGGGYPTRMKPPYQFSHPAITGNRVLFRFVYDI